MTQNNNPVFFNRPAVFAAAALASGIALSGLLKANFIVTAVLFVSAVSCLAYLHFTGKETTRGMFLLIFGAGMLLHSVSVNQMPQNHLAKYFSLNPSIKPAYVEMRVVDVPKKSKKSIRFTGNVSSVSDKRGMKAAGVTGKISVYVERKLGVEIKYGDILRVKGAPENIESVRKRTGDGYADYLKRRKILYTMYARDTAVDVKGNRASNPYLMLSSAARERAQAIIDAGLPPKQAGILKGIMLGDKNEVPGALYDMFRITGTVHILAVSGMNVGLVAFFIFLLFKLARVSRRVAAAMTIMLVWVFAAMTGADASVIRASVMATFALAGIVIFRDTDILNALACAGFVILLADPQQLFDIGFQLSFLATFGLIYLGPFFASKLPEMNRTLSETLLSTVTAQIFIIPVLINTFNQLSMISVIANMFIVPLSSVLTIIGFAMWLIGGIVPETAAIFGASAWLVINIMEWVVTLFSKIPFAAISVAGLPVWFTFFYYVFFLILPHEDILLRVKGLDMKPAAAAAMLVFIPLAGAFTGRPGMAAAYSSGTVTAVFAKVKGAGNVMLLYQGGGFGPKAAGMDKMVSYLRGRGVNRVDALALYGIHDGTAADTFQRNFRVKNIFADDESVKPAGMKAIGLPFEKHGLKLGEYTAEMDTGKGGIIFGKVLTTEMTEKTGKYAFCAYCAKDKAAIMSRQNTLVINERLKGKRVTGGNVVNLSGRGIYEIPQGTAENP